jgi:hypothetical protein
MRPDATTPGARRVDAAEPRTPRLHCTAPRPRQHDPVGDRLGLAKPTVLGNLACRGVAQNAARLESVRTAADPICKKMPIRFAPHPHLARREIAASRYRDGPRRPALPAPPSDPTRHRPLGGNPG